MPRGHVLPDGARVASLRGEADLTQWELAEAAGYGLRTIGKIEDSHPTGAKTLSAVATVLSRRLKRSVELADLLRRPDANGERPVRSSGVEPCQVEEGLKFLDLSQWRPRASATATESRVTLLDRYRFRKLPAQLPMLTFPYASLGERIEGECLSHVRHSEWSTAAAAAKDKTLNVGYEMRIHVEKMADGTGELQNRLEFINAFAGQERERFHAVVIYPTECLTLLLSFPPDKPCRTIQGSCKSQPEAKWRSPETQPSRLQDGQLAYWHLKAPCVGVIYQLEWRW